MQNQQNPYCLAQYIVINPDRKTEFDFLNVDPILNQLPGKLFAFIVELFYEEHSFQKMLSEDEHPNQFLQRLAQRADELCPGRSHSDLLYKQLVVNQVFMTFIKALYKVAMGEKLKPISFAFHGSSILNDLEEILKSTKR